MMNIHHTEALVRDRHRELHDEAAHRRTLRRAEQVPTWRQRTGRLLVRIGRRLDRPRNDAETLPRTPAATVTSGGTAAAPATGASAATSPARASYCGGATQPPPLAAVPGGDPTPARLPNFPSRSIREAASA